MVCVDAALRSLHKVENGGGGLLNQRRTAQTRLKPNDQTTRTPACCVQIMLLGESHSGGGCVSITSCNVGFASCS